MTDYECECLDCGHKFKSSEHCVDASCPECGGDSRRADRPGDGKENRKVSEEFNLSLSNGKLGKFEFLDDESNNSKRVMRFELMDNVELYNGVRFTQEALQHQLDIFNEGNFLVTHGMDHTGDTLDQLGKVIRMEMDVMGDIATVFIVSEHYKETFAQQQAEILFKQGLLDSISGGWRASIAFNENTDEFEVYKPMLREVSSTPIPAKTNATSLENEQTIQDMCMSLKNSNPKIVNKEEIETDEEDIPLEESDMSDEEKPTETSDEVTQEASAEMTALQEKVDAQAKDFAEMKASQEAAVRTSLIEKAVELGLSEEDFTDMPNEAISYSLEVANKVRMSTLRENGPDITLGDDGQPQEMAESDVIDAYYTWTLE